MDLTRSIERFVRAVGGPNVSAAEGRRLCEGLRPLARNHRIANGRAARLEQRRDMLAFVINGNAKLVAQTPSGREQVIAFHLAGDLVDIPARSEHAYALCGIGTCELLSFARSDLLAAVRDEPVLLEAVFSCVVDGLGRCRDSAVNLGRKSASERVASFLLTMAKHGKREPGGALVIDLPMSRRDVGDCLGLTIETISRQISEMRKEGLIATPSRARVELLDSAELQARANHFATAAYFGAN